tara:strand:- start:754 stop:1587 length:834 start_codon:yes stop_codon:yes gene_type:complete
MQINETYVQIGQRLKNSRLKKKLTLEKISKKTKISIQKLINIENGELHLLAGEFYQRSFIKSYCAALRISEKKILLLLDNSKYKSYKDSDFDEKKESHLKKTSTPLLAEKIPTMPLIVFASLGLITFFLFNFYIDTGQPDTQDIAVIEPKPEEQFPKIEENTIDQIEESATIKQARIDNSDDIQNYQMHNNQKHTNQIVAKNDVWIEIKDFNENILISTVLKKDEFFKLPNNKREIIISASNAGSLFLKDENNNFTDLGSSGDILNSIQLNSLITNH